jgi:hypothetical protein
LDTNALPERDELEGTVEKSVMIRLISTDEFRLGLWLVGGYGTDGLAVGIAKEATLILNIGTFVASPILYVFRVLPW